MSSTEPVRLLVANQRAYVWDVQGVSVKRSASPMLSPSLCTLPQLGQQNVFLGLPLLLLPEEVVTLVRNNLAVLIDDVAAHRRATPEQARTYALQRDKAIETQIRLAQQAEQEKQAKMADVIARNREEKRRKQALEREAQVKAAQNESRAATQQDEENLDLFVSGKLDGKDTTGPPPALSGKALAEHPHTIVIQPSSIDLPWYDPESAKYTTLEAARQAGIWHYPETPLQQTRCDVFQDLWRKGYFMGGGLRFGGDFLVYPGDPLRYHSHFTLTVLTAPRSTVMPLDLVAYGRLATAVKKAHLLASWDDEAQQAQYFSLEWAAFG
ncbi:tRNA-splicing endonuclease subunit [Microbotryomycetes sp. JL201]|nr:tRNA-splicing endonuclease subunit [Microbotryomycetes sp. JL201]